jgi:hypothetical protein
VTIVIGTTVRDSYAAYGGLELSEADVVRAVALGLGALVGAS